MKVKCKKILTNRPNRKDCGQQTDDLTVGKEYIVLVVYFGHEGVLFYQIEADCGDLIIFEADQFEVLSTHIPSNWEITARAYEDGSYYLKLAPKSWNNASIDFYEEITEVTGPLESWREEESGMPEVMKLYFQAKDIIYREESQVSGK